MTPFAQILAGLRSVRNNFIQLTNVPFPQTRYVINDLFFFLCLVFDACSRSLRGTFIARDFGIMCGKDASSCPASDVQSPGTGVRTDSRSSSHFLLGDYLSYLTSLLPVVPLNPNCRVYLVTQKDWRVIDFYDSRTMIYFLCRRSSFLVTSRPSSHLLLLLHILLFLCVYLPSFTRMALTSLASSLSRFAKLNGGDDDDKKLQTRRNACDID